MPLLGVDEDEVGPLSQAQARQALRRALTELRAIYRQADAAYAPYSCPASGECCQLAKTQRPPWLWRPEWELLQQAAPLPPPRSDGGCPYLDAQGLRCTVYANRPLGCRTFFCDRIRGPLRQPREQLDALFLRIEQVAQRLEPEARGPRSLLDWHHEAMSTKSPHSA